MCRADVERLRGRARRAGRAHARRLAGGEQRAESAGCIANDRGHTRYTGSTDSCPPAEHIALAVGACTDNADHADAICADTRVERRCNPVFERDSNARVERHAAASHAAASYTADYCPQYTECRAERC
jgi:hypothetical protein